MNWKVRSLSTALSGHELTTRGSGRSVDCNVHGLRWILIIVARSLQQGTGVSPCLPARKCLFDMNPRSLERIQSYLDIEHE
jgi:hypothetical protein